MPAKIIIKNNGNYLFEMFASNGEKIIFSEEFRSPHHCMNGIQRFQDHCRSAHHFLKKSNPAGQFYFNVTDPDGNIVATSDMFWSATSRDYAINIVRRECEEAEVVY